MKNYSSEISLGLLSGFLSTLIVLASSEMFISPGIVFGAVIAWKYKVRFLSKALPFIILSTLGYFTAVIITMNLMDAFQSYYVPLLIAGSVGASILLLGFYLFIRRLSPLRLALLIPLGGVLGITFMLFPSFILNTSEYANFFTLYVCWQIGMLVGIRWVELQMSKAAK